MKLTTDEQAALKVLRAYLGFPPVEPGKWLMFQSFQSFPWASGEFMRGVNYALERGWIEKGPKTLSYILTEEGFELL